MKCKSCQKEASVTQFKNMGPLCTGCFCELIEKRVRRELRINNPLKPQSKIAVIDNGSKESFVALLFLRNLAKDMPLTIEPQKPPFDAKQWDIIVIPWDGDDDAEQTLRGIFDGRNIEMSGFKLLTCVSDAEVRIVAEANGWQGQDNSYQSEYGKFLAETEKKYPGTIFSLVRSAKEVRSLETVK